jgi:hypothetical protein
MSPIGIDSKLSGFNLIKSKTGLPNRTLSVPVIPKTIKIMANWKLEDIPHFSFKRL